MPTYAYIRSNTVAETVTCDDVSAHYHPDYVKACVMLSPADAARVAPSWTVASDGTFAAPLPKAVIKSATMTPLEFQARFHADEMTSIAQAAMTSTALFLFMLQMASAQTIDVSDTRTVAGVGALVAAKLLTAERGTAILTP